MTFFRGDHMISVKKHFKAKEQDGTNIITQEVIKECLIECFEGD